MVWKQGTAHCQDLEKKKQALWNWRNQALGSPLQNVMKQFYFVAISTASSSDEKR
jgi:hypothetical protein